MAIHEAIRICKMTIATSFIQFSKVQIYLIQWLHYVHMDETKIVSKHWHLKTHYKTMAKQSDSVGVLPGLCLFKIGKGVYQGYILSPCLFNLYAEYIMRNAGLDEAQAGIKIAGRNISNLIYADDTTLMAESEEELKSLLIKVKEESEKVGLKLNISEN